MEAGVKLGVQSIQIAIACTVYHKFFCKINMDSYDPYLIAMSSIYMTGKIEEQYPHTYDTIVSNKYWHPGQGMWEGIPFSRPVKDGRYCCFLSYKYIGSQYLSEAESSHEDLLVNGAGNVSSLDLEYVLSADRCLDDLTKPTIDNIVSDLIQIYIMDTEISLKPCSRLVQRSPGWLAGDDATTSL